VPSPIFEGLQAIHRKLLGFLEAQGVTPFDSVGQPFDPTLHEAIGSVRSDKYESGIVAEEVQHGYRMGDELLRPARVRVTQ
jgi:molecular chaperone GrpE